MVVSHLQVFLDETDYLIPFQLDFVFGDRNRLRHMLNSLHWEIDRGNATLLIRLDSLVIFYTFTMVSFCTIDEDGWHHILVLLFISEGQGQESSTQEHNSVGGFLLYPLTFNLQVSTRFQLVLPAIYNYRKPLSEVILRLGCKPIR